MLLRVKMYVNNLIKNTFYILQTCQDQSSEMKDTQS